MKPFPSLQEEVIHNFSQNILGKQTLFRPAFYGNSLEPADVAWITNRCAILMYMTASSKPFATKRKHNLNQMRGWLNALEQRSYTCRPRLNFCGVVE
jgi:hypothetical protein